MPRLRLGGLRPLRCAMVRTFVPYNSYRHDSTLSVNYESKDQAAGRAIKLGYSTEILYRCTVEVVDVDCSM
jgi:hypothetical protein